MSLVRNNLSFQCNGCVHNLSYIQNNGYIEALFCCGLPALSETAALHLIILGELNIFDEFN